MFGIDDILIGSALSFGGSLLSGFGAASSAKKQQKMAIALQAAADAHNQSVGREMLARYAPEQIPKDAYAAGYNPVTWLGAMGGSYGALWSQGWSMQQQGVAPTVRIPSALEAVGSAISSAGSTFSSMTQNRERVQAQVYQTQMQGYLGEIQAMRRNGNALAGLGTPFFSTTFAGPTGGGAVAALSLGRAALRSALREPKTNVYGIAEKPPEATSPSFWTGDTSVSGASTAQNAYDWPMSIPYGAYKQFADIYRTFTGRQVAGDVLADWSESFRAPGGTERTQAHQAEADGMAFQGLPFFARRVPELQWLARQRPATPFWENPHVFQ